MNAYWTLIGLFTVSTFGLLSCGSNKPTPAKEDTWKLTEPLLQSSSDAYPVPFPKLGPSRLAADSVLQFPASTDLLDVTFSVQSSCRLGKLAAEQKLSFKSASQIPIRSLIPKEFLISLAPLNEEELECDFSFEATNSLGSKHSFAIKTARLVKVEQLNNLDLGLQDVTRPSGSLTTGVAKVQERVLNVSSLNKQTIRTSTEVLTNPSEQVYSLECDRFKNSRRFSQAIDMGTAIDQLMNGPLSSSPKDGQDPRLSYRKQCCRLLVQSTDPSTRLPWLHVTPPFVAEWRITPVETQFQWKLSEVTQETFSQQTIAQMIVRNVSPSPVRLAITKGGGQIALQYHFNSTDPRRVMAGEKILENYVTLPSNFSRVVENQHGYTVELAGNSAGVIEFKLNSGRRCEMSVDPRVIGNPNISAFAGFAFAWSDLPRVIQYKNWGAVESTEGEDAIQVFVPDIPSNTVPDPLPGWSPQVNWARAHGYEKPAAVRADPNWMDQGCYNSTKHMHYNWGRAAISRPH